MTQGSLGTLECLMSDQITSDKIMLLRFMFNVNLSYHFLQILFAYLLIRDKSLRFYTLCVYEFYYTLYKSSERLIYLFTRCFDDDYVDDKSDCQLLYPLIGIRICNHVVESDMLYLIFCMRFPEFPFLFLFYIA